jgi:hypothetical protein
MEIHKPKPWHGSREFLKELGTIVLGILIALSLEQMVETAHEAKESREARDAVRAEVATNLAVLEWRRSEQACIDARLAELRRIVDAAQDGKPFPTVRWIGWPTTFPIFTFRVQSAAQAGRASLFTSEEQKGYAAVYFPLEEYLAKGREEDATWARLQGLIGLTRMTPEMALSLRQTVAEAEAENFRMRLTATRASQSASRLHLAPSPDEPNRARRLTCVPLAGPAPTPAQAWAID